MSSENQLINNVDENATNLPKVKSKCGRRRKYTPEEAKQKNRERAKIRSDRIRAEYKRNKEIINELKSKFTNI